MLTDPIADLLTTIRNGQAVRLASVSVPSSKMKKGILEVLKGEGYIQEYTEEEIRPGVAQIKIALKYHDAHPVIRKINRISKPGRRVYSAIDDLPKVHNGLGLSILSTSKGILADYRAREANVGGEILCNVF